MIVAIIHSFRLCHQVSLVVYSLGIICFPPSDLIAVAVCDPNLLNLMLAYSASHRARYLEHPEPANRIAHWVSDVFPGLRLALEGPHENITDGHLATAIMLLSLKIISPSTFEVPIPWQNHLKLARDLFLARGGETLAASSRVGAFLSRWIGYIDTLGVLSSRHCDPPIFHNYDMDNSCIVDCFTGYTPRTGLFLTRLGNLTYRCDNERFDDTGQFRDNGNWKPSSDVVSAALDLLSEFGTLDESARAAPGHHRDSEVQEFLSSDLAFRCAGLVNLHRRVLGHSSESLEMLEVLDQLIRALSRIPLGSPCEVQVLFPIFTAGCETRDPQLRAEIMSRISALERTGMKQVSIYCLLLQIFFSLVWLG